MKPNATTTVSRIIPTNANNAALLRLMVGIIRPQFRCRDQDEAKPHVFRTNPICRAISVHGCRIALGL